MPLTYLKFKWIWFTISLLHIWSNWHLIILVLKTNSSMLSLLNLLLINIESRWDYEQVIFNWLSHNSSWIEPIWICSIFAFNTHSFDQFLIGIIYYKFILRLLCCCMHAISSWYYKKTLSQIHLYRYLDSYNSRY